MDYEEFLSYFGVFGWYNILMLVLIAVAGNLWYSVNGYLINFTGASMDHWCHVPELADRPRHEQLELGIPWDDEKKEYSSCFMYTTPRVNLTDNHTWSPDSVMRCQYGWDYDTDMLKSTYIQNWDLVCSGQPGGYDGLDESQLAVPVFIVGQFVGSLLVGYLSNKLGRKTAHTLAVVMMCLACVMCSLSVHQYMFIAARFLAAVAGIMVTIIGYTLGAELTPSAYREVASTIQTVIYMMGVALTSGFAYFVRGWRLLQLTTALAAIPFLILYCVLVPESPRWLVWKERREEAVKVLARISRLGNTTTAPETIVQEFVEPPSEKEKLAEEEFESEAHEEEQIGYKDLFINPVTCRSLLTIIVCWCTTTFTYFAVGYTVDNLFGDIYMNMAVLGFVEMTAVVITPLSLRKLGRVKTLAGIFAIMFIAGGTAIACLSAGVAEMVVSVSAILCRACSAAGSNSISVYCLELFPTPVRNLALGVAYAMCYGFATVGPYLAGTVSKQWAPLPYVIYTTLSIVSFCLATWLPETKGKPVPETIEELENLKNTPVIDLDEEGIENEGFTQYPDDPEKALPPYMNDMKRPSHISINDIVVNNVDLTITPIGTSATTPLHAHRRISYAPSLASSYAPSSRPSRRKSSIFSIDNRSMSSHAPGLKMKTQFTLGSPDQLETSLKCLQKIMEEITVSHIDVRFTPMATAGTIEVGTPSSTPHGTPRIGRRHHRASNASSIFSGRFHRPSDTSSIHPEHFNAPHLLNVPRGSNASMILPVPSIKTHHEISPLALGAISPLALNVHRGSNASTILPATSTIAPVHHPISPLTSDDRPPSYTSIDKATEEEEAPSVSKL